MADNPYRHAIIGCFWHQSAPIGRWPIDPGDLEEDPDLAIQQLQALVENQLFKKVEKKRLFVEKCDLVNTFLG